MLGHHHHHRKHHGMPTPALSVSGMFHTKHHGGKFKRAAKKAFRKVSRPARQYAKTKKSYAKAKYGKAKTKAKKYYSIKKQHFKKKAKTALGHIVHAANHEAKKLTNEIHDLIQRTAAHAADIVKESAGVAGGTAALGGVGYGLQNALAGLGAMGPEELAALMLTV